MTKTPQKQPLEASESDVKLKSTIRIPTEQYAYFEVEFEGTAQEIVDQHSKLQKLYKGGAGIPDKDFNEFLDKYMSTNTGSGDIYAAMSLEQQGIIQAVKRSMKRLTYNKEHGVQD